MNIFNAVVNVILMVVVCSRTQSSSSGETNESEIEPGVFVVTASRKAREMRQSQQQKIQPLHFVPKLMIFQPDRVFWPFRVGTEVVPPFGMRRNQPTTIRGRTQTAVQDGDFGGREIVDRNGSVLKVYSETPQVFAKLKKKGIRIAVAATLQTTKEVATMKHVLHLFDLDHFFNYMEIDLESAVDQVTAIKEESGLEFKDIVYLGTDQTALNQIKNDLKVLTVNVNPEKGLNIMHMYIAIYFYNLRPHIAAMKMKQLKSKQKIENSESEYEPVKEYKTYNKYGNSRFSRPWKKTRNLYGGKTFSKYNYKPYSAKYPTRRRFYRLYARSE